MAQVGINKIRKHSRPCSADIFVRFPSKHAALNHHEERERRSPRRARSLAVSTISGWEPGQAAGHAADPNPTRRILLRLPACLVLRPFFSSSTERRRRDLGSPSLGRPFVLGAEQRALPVSQATQEPAVQHIRNRTPRNEGMELMVESTNHRRLAALQAHQSNPNGKGKKKKIG